MKTFNVDNKRDGYMEWVKGISLQGFWEAYNNDHFKIKDFSKPKELKMEAGDIIEAIDSGDRAVLVEYLLNGDWAANANSFIDNKINGEWIINERDFRVVEPVNKATKPPLDVKPKAIFDDDKRRERMKDLARAINGYLQEELFNPSLKEWCQELLNHLEERE